MSYDEEGEREWLNPEGMLVGKQAALADWVYRKDNKQFEKLIAVLRAKKWAKENPERRKEIVRKYDSAPENRADAYARRKKTRDVKWEKKNKTGTCRCGARFALSRIGGKRKWCSHACGEKHNRRVRTSSASTRSTTEAA